MRAELLTGDQEKDLAVMVQDLLSLEATAKDLAVQLGRTPTDVEWMEAAGAAGSTGDVQLALNSFQARLQAGRSAKQVRPEGGAPGQLAGPMFCVRALAAGCGSCIQPLSTNICQQCCPLCSTARRTVGPVSGLSYTRPVS